MKIVGPAAEQGNQAIEAARTPRGSFPGCRSCAWPAPASRSCRGQWQSQGCGLVATPAGGAVRLPWAGPAPRGLRTSRPSVLGLECVCFCLVRTATKRLYMCDVDFVRADPGHRRFPVPPTHNTCVSESGGVKLPRQERRGQDRPSRRRVALAATALGTAPSAPASFGLVLL